MGADEDEVPLGGTGLIALLPQGLDSPRAAFALGGDELLGDLGVIEDLLAEQECQGIHIEGELGVFDVMNDSWVRDDDAQAASGQREQLREGAHDDDVVVGLRQVDERVGVEVMVGLVDDDHGVHGASRLNGRDDVFSAEGVAHRVVRVQQHDDVGVGTDGGDEVFHVERQIVVVGDRHMVQPENIAVHPVHLERGGHSDHVVPLPAERLQQVADGLVGAVGGRNAIARDAHVLRILREEAVGLGVDG